MKLHEQTEPRKRVAMAEALRESEERFRLLMNEAKDYAIIMLDPEGYVIHWNAGAQRLKGYRAEEILGEHFSRFYVPEDIERRKPAWALERAAAAGRVEDVGWRVRKDGRLFWADVVLTPLHDPSGKLIGFSELVRDISERKRAEEALRLSEERAKAQYKNFPVPTFTWQKDPERGFVLVDFNDAGNTFTQGQIADLIGTTADALFPDAPEIIGEITRCFEEMTAIRREMFFQLRSTGEFKHLDVTYVFAPPDKVLVHSLDITPRKQAEEALRASEERLQQTLSLLRTTLESTADGILVVDLAGKVASYNRRFASLWRIPEDLLATRDDVKLLNFVLEQLVDPEAFLRQVRALMSEPEAESQDELRFKDGRVFERNSQPQHINGQVVGRVWSFHDVTGWKQAEEALQSAKEQLDQYAHELEERVDERTARLEVTIRSLQGVLYHVAHDLRAPVRTLTSFTQLLTETQASRLDAEGRDYADRIVAAATRMDRLILDLLEFGRLGHLYPAFSRVELEQSIDGVVLHMSRKIAAKNAKVHVERPLPAVWADPALLKLVLANLLQNALTYVAPQVAPRARIWAEPCGARVRLWVEDNGIGINPAYREQIFRVFERLHREDEYSGTGMGLAMVAKAMERMGGAVGVEANPAGGSRFWLELEPSARG